MNTITRKEIAALAGVSLRTIVYREKEWGLIAVRSKASKRPVLYFRVRAIAILTQAGVLG